MAYVITSGCVDIKDRACVDVCPVDCIYEGDRKLYIQPVECIDCGACAPACPQSAIFFDLEVPVDEAGHVADNERFFTEPLPGRDAPLGEPGGATGLSPVGVDTADLAELVGRKDAS